MNMFIRLIYLSFFSSFFSLSGCWVNSESLVKTIYYQGIFSSQAQLAKLTGSHGFEATTGEHVVCEKGIDVIQDPFIGHEIEEVIPQKLYCGIISILSKCFFHPVRNIQEYFSSFQNAYNGIKVSNSSGLRLTETVGAHSIDFKKVSIGQDCDIVEHKQKYNECCTENPEANIVLYGVSRGAATTFIAAALNEYDFNKIKLVALEGCFDSIRTVLSKRWYTSLWPNLARYILSLCTSYKLDGISPIEVVNQFPEQVPVAFITSVKDRSVPMECTQILVEALVKRGKNPVYLLVLQNSSHPGYALDDEEDKSLYLHFMHSLYKQLNLPYIDEYAGQEELVKLTKLN